MTVAELIAVLKELDPAAKVVAPFSPNPEDINIEAVGGAHTRQDSPFAGSVELSRAGRPDPHPADSNQTLSLPTKYI